jgi:glycosyltransferase involved in cell wall biosynthesis
MSKSPAISVIVPCHNSAPFVEHTLASLQAQTFTDWEAILIDDGSTDGTGERLASWTERDKRIRLIRQHNQGLAKARNIGVSNATGKFLHFLDSDDWMLDDAYANMATRLLEVPDIAGVYCGMTICTEHGIIAKQYECPLTEWVTFNRVALDNPFPIHSVLIRRDVLDVVGLFDETLQHCQDWDLWGRVFRCGFRLIPVPGPFAVYRMVRTSLSARHNTFWRTGLRVLQRLYAEDSRCQNPVQDWVKGADKSQYPLSIKTWASYCLPRAISSGDSETVEEIMETMTSMPNALPEAHEIAHALLRGLVLWNPDGPRTFPALWQLRRDLILGVLTRIGEASTKPVYVSDALGRFLCGVQRILGTRELLRISATIPSYLLPMVFKLSQHKAKRLLRIR